MHEQNVQGSRFEHQHYINFKSWRPVLNVKTPNSNRLKSNRNCYYQLGLLAFQLCMQCHYHLDILPSCDMSFFNLETKGYDKISSHFPKILERVFFFFLETHPCSGFICLQTNISTLNFLCTCTHLLFLDLFIVCFQIQIRKYEKSKHY